MAGIRYQLDEEIAKQVAKEMEGYEGDPNQWADRTVNVIRFGYDADEEVEKSWETNGARIEKIGRDGVSAGWGRGCGGVERSLERFLIKL
ncbi:hypothetical protein JAAARDRAFT_42614 [Jaapia argillacea MUCL 33604]|uniref:Uncharacterized protein n=1 Tax=Jaapia argillacea MUCL 33604 TaxID=933084 RepID=A0A067PF65_9AGAM|nr:hypothetical protein JAAARDRAFT_42614 [Jaapia argillacea MUCL 33604]